MNLVFRHASKEMGLVPIGEKYVGKRMSGQEVTCDLGTIRSIKVGSKMKENVKVGILDMKLPQELSEIKGILSLNFFEDEPFTVDFDSKILFLENSTSISERYTNGTSVPILLRRNKSSTDIFVDLKLSNGNIINVEVDTGSDVLILNEDLMEPLGVRKDSNLVKKMEGKDETGNVFTRYFSKIPGKISLAEEESIFQTEPEVMFQKIIYEGLLGRSFLKWQHILTFDLPGSRMIFFHNEKKES